MRFSPGASIAELERVYRADFPRFVRVATAIAGDEESGADAVHDAFVQAVRARRSYRGEGPLEGWVWRMVVNAAKKRALTPKEIGHEQPHANENGFGDPVRSLIAALPERQRLALFLRSALPGRDNEERDDGHDPGRNGELKPLAAARALEPMPLR
jgi:DNA-directed RNA polymerase specialized sigma24 family protein